ncbi:hypothetical protein D9619_000038 [Psilocybe cf. subviscida]|uniref:Uncharacterized protein n=1 Tax=Psilocybe cf. subviscida TaxID=2480587 RepID=A0A8H5BFB6_9AGAR|nr:hypothetical protein D9619_000038 [Psilocybe cf. subviscida]
MSTVEIDDRDSSIIWTGLWIRTGTASEHDATVSGSRNAGNTALVSFIGTSITVYGTIPQRGTNISSISLYSLDGDPVAGTFAPPPSPDVQPQQKFFVSPDLPYGSHQLYILDTIISDGLWLDFFTVTTGLGPGTLSVAPVQSNAGSSQPTESSGTSSKAYSESWVIPVSLAVGGCAIFAALLLTVYSLRRLRSSGRDARAAQIPEPFTIDPSPQGGFVSPEPGHSSRGIHRKAGLGMLCGRPHMRSRSQAPGCSTLPPNYVEIQSSQPETG